MHVLHLTRDHPPRGNGGLSTAVGGMTAATVAAGHRCSVVSFDAWRPRGGGEHGPPAAEDVAGVAVLRLRGPDQLDAARAWARGRRADVVHVHDGFLWEASEGLGAPRVFSVHVAQVAMARWRGLDPLPRSATLQQRALAEADRVVVPSPGVEVAVDAARRRVVPLGVQDHPRARAAVGAPRPDAALLFVGRFADVKGLDRLFAAWARVRSVRPATLTVVGGLPDSPKGERRWRRRLAQWAAGAPWEAPGWLRGDALSDAYAAATVLVVPSVYETFGLTTAEGMLHGLPVVATDTPGSRWLVREGGTIVGHRPEDLAVGILRILDGDPRATGVAAAASVRARATWTGSEGPSGTLIAAYRELVGTTK